MAAKKVLLVAGLLCIVLVIFGLFPILNKALHPGTSTTIGDKEKQEILESKKAFIDNLFNGYIGQDYTGFSNDLDDKMKERWDEPEFLRLYNDYGNLIMKDCSGLEKSFGSVTVLCSAEFENKRAKVSINFDLANKINGLSIIAAKPNVKVFVNSNKTTESLKITSNNTRKTLVPPEEYLFMILDVTVTNNENNSASVHAYKFDAGNYVFDALEPEYRPDCNMLLSGKLKANEIITGCLVFSVQKGYEEGSVVVE